MRSNRRKITLKRLQNPPFIKVYIFSSSVDELYINFTKEYDFSKIHFSNFDHRNHQTGLYQPLWSNLNSIECCIVILHLKLH